MTPEQYTEKLKSAQKLLNSAWEDLETAIEKMEKRCETGYSYFEQQSFNATLNARESAKYAEELLIKIHTSIINY